MKDKERIDKLEEEQEDLFKAISNISKKAKKFREDVENGRIERRTKTRKKTRRTFS